MTQTLRAASRASATASICASLMAWKLASRLAMPCSTWACAERTLVASDAEARNRREPVCFSARAWRRAAS
jgi:hypothetical protein